MTGRETPVWSLAHDAGDRLPSRPDCARSPLRADAA